MYLNVCVRPPVRVFPPPAGPIHFTFSLCVCFLAMQSGTYGYTAYSASKFALVGMAQSLQMEVGVSGSVCGKALACGAQGIG